MLDYLRLNYLSSSLIIFFLVAPNAIAEVSKQPSVSEASQFFEDNQGTPHLPPSINKNSINSPSDLSLRFSSPSPPPSEVTQLVAPPLSVAKQELATVNTATIHQHSPNNNLGVSVPVQRSLPPRGIHSGCGQNQLAMERTRETRESHFCNQLLTTTPIHSSAIVSQVSPAQFDQNSSEGFQLDEPLAEVPSVSQLSDVKPTDWAFQALQSLNEHYGCLAGYPDSTFRGNREIKRYEFAAGFNACLSQISVRTATKEDLLTLQKLQNDFAPELALLQSRVDALEARTTKLEAKQFSTTLLLRGEAIFGLATAAGGNPPGQGETNTVLNYQARLNFVTSFTGKDRLLLTLATGNFDNFGFANANSFNTYMALLNYQTGLNNRVVLNNLEYRLAAFGDRVVFTFKPVGFILSDVLTANSPYIDAGQGAVSRFAALSPVFQIGELDSGLGFDWLLNRQTRLQVAYGTRNTGNNAQGLFASKHSTLGVQLLLKPSDNLSTGLAYVNAYSSDGRLDTFTGSFNADTSGTFLEPAQIHALNATVQWRLAHNLTLGAWGGVIYTHSLTSQAVALSGTALLSLGISDPLGRPGDLLVLLVGVPPKLFVGGEIERVDRGTSLHVESFYRLKLTDNISISPGFFVVTNPGHIDQNNTIFVGVIRTNFRF